MYCLTQVEDRQMLASSVATPFAKGLPIELAKLCVAHLMIADGASFSELIPVIGSLNTQQVDLARLQFLHFLNEVEDTFEADTHHMYQKIDEFSKNSTMEYVYQDIAKDIIKQTQQCIKQVECHPKDKELLTLLNNHLQYLSELNEMGKRLGLTLNISAVKNQYKHLSRLSSVYEELRDLLSWSEWMKKGETLIIPQNLQDLNHKRAHMHVVCGDRSTLWYYVQRSTKEQKHMQQNGYRQLNETEAQELKTYMVEMIKAFDFYNASSPVSTLFAIKTLVDFNASLYQAKADSTMKEVIEKDQKKQQVPHTPSRQKVLLKDKKFQDEYAQKLYALSNTLEQAMQKLQGKTPLTLRFEGSLDKKTIKGSFNQNTDFDIRLERINLEEYPNAITLCVMKKGEVKPRQSSFLGFAQMMEEMKDEFVQKFFFDQTFLIQNVTTNNV